MDFTKGVLVLTMVLYHWLNYFTDPRGSFDVYRYLRFLTPSFIFITGFLISHVYLSRSETAGSAFVWRLLGRGLRILALFVVLNLAIRYLTLRELGAIVEFFDRQNLFVTFVTGSTAGAPAARVASFFVLVPIAYLLILSACLFGLWRRAPYVFHWVALGGLVSIAALNTEGLESPHLELITIGLLGVVLGQAPIALINRLAGHGILLGLAYACYLWAITMWNVRYPLQLVGVCLSLLLIYRWGLSTPRLANARERIVVIGKYSLFAYIVQIAILQVLRLGMGRLGLGALGLSVSIVVAFLATLLAIDAIRLAREHVRIIDRMYGAVFS